jgi:hypothetical protein
MPAPDGYVIDTLAVPARRHSNPEPATSAGMAQASRGRRRCCDRPSRGVGRWVLLAWCRVCLRCLARRRCDWAVVVRRTGQCVAPNLVAGSGTTGTTVLVGGASPRRRPTLVSAVAGGVGGLHVRAARAPSCLPAVLSISGLPHRRPPRTEPCASSGGIRGQ